MASAGDVFLNAISRATGISPGVLGYWINQEGTYAPRGTGGFNFLNLRPEAGDPYSSVSPGNFEQFSNVNDAITATERRLNEPFMSALMQTVKAGGSPAAQWNAIQGTGWDINHYAGSGFSPTTNIGLPGPDVGAGAGGGATRMTTDAGGDYGNYDPSAAIAFARQYIGTPYSWGGGSPSGPTLGLPGTSGANIRGFDCSGLVQSALLHAGAHGIGRTSFDQWGQGTPVSHDQLQPGDVVFYKGQDFETGANGQVLPGHEALYIGSGKIIVAPQTGGKVELADINSIGDYMGARRYVSSAEAGTAAATHATATLGQKATPQPKQPKDTLPKFAPTPATAPLQGMHPGAMASILNTPTVNTFHDPFVFKPGVAQAPLIPAAASTIPTTTMPSFTPPTPAQPSFLNALTGR